MMNREYKLTVKEYMDIIHRLDVLESRLSEREKDELDWAVSHLDSLTKDEDTMKAWSIILKKLGVRKTSLRPKITYVKTGNDSIRKIP